LRTFPIAVILLAQAFLYFFDVAVVWRSFRRVFKRGYLLSRRFFVVARLVQQRLATSAQHMPEIAFTSPAHDMTLEWLEAAHHRPRKDGSSRIDGVTA
jgi:hypothetical protein